MNSSSLVFGKYSYVQPIPCLYVIDVLGETIQKDSNSQWKELAKDFGEYLNIYDQYAMLIYTDELDVDMMEKQEIFTVDQRIYYISAISDNISQLSDIMESERFIFGLNVSIVFFEQQKTIFDLKNDAEFVAEMRFLAENSDKMATLTVKNEVISAVADGIELMWFNPKHL